MIRKESLDPTSLISGGAGGLSQILVSFILIFTRNNRNYIVFVLLFKTQNILFISIF